MLDTDSYFTNGVYIDRIGGMEEKTEAEESNTSPFSLRLAQYVLEHYQEDLSLKSLAARVGFSNATYFCTVFKKETGLSPDRYRKEFGKK